MQQLISTINLRKFREDRTRRLETTWMARAISTFIAAGYFSEDNSKAVEAASNMTLDEIERKIIEADVRVLAEPELKSGGTEKLMMAFGGFSG